MNTLFNLTRHRSGIVLRDGRRYICDDWSAGGLPILFPDGVLCLGEPLPRHDSSYYEDRLDLIPELAGMDYGKRKQPYRGMMYLFGSTTIIAPDEWE